MDSCPRIWQSSYHAYKNATNWCYYYSATSFQMMMIRVPIESIWFDTDYVNSMFLQITFTIILNPICFKSNKLWNKYNILLQKPTFWISHIWKLLHLTAFIRNYSERFMSELSQLQTIATCIGCFQYGNSTVYYETMCKRQQNRIIN